MCSASDMGSTPNAPLPKVTWRFRIRKLRDQAKSRCSKLVFGRLELGLTFSPSNFTRASANFSRTLVGCMAFKITLQTVSLCWRMILHLVSDRYGNNVMSRRICQSSLSPDWKVDGKSRGEFHCSIRAIERLERTPPRRLLQPHRVLQPITELLRVSRACLREGDLQRDCKSHMSLTVWPRFLLRAPGLGYPRRRPTFSRAWPHRLGVRLARSVGKTGATF